MSINTFFLLATTSKSRKLILKNLGLNFKTIPHGCDENYYKKKFLKLKYSPKKISLQLAKNKAKSIKIKNKTIVGSDTVINFNGKIIEKAKNILEAKKKIKQLSGKKHTIISSAAAYFNNKLVWHCSKEAKVTLRKLKDREIEKYLKSCGLGVLDSVGCYKIEKNGAIIIKNIKGDFFSVMGFPLFPFLIFLKKFIKKFNLKKNETMNFLEVDNNKFPIYYYFRTLDFNSPKNIIKFNISNQYAVDLFKDKKIIYGDIVKNIAKFMKININSPVNSVENVINFHYDFKRLLLNSKI